MAKVSVIMPCFNHGKFVMDSMNGILGQTYSDLELIVVDDSSQDNSWETILKVANTDARVKTIRHQQNQGASKSRNDALYFASGEFIGFCDADDIWEREKLEIQIKFLQSNPEYDLMYCDTTIIDEHGLPTGTRFSERFPPPRSSSGKLFHNLVTRNFINMQSVLMRKECVCSAGRFDENIKWVEDWWYWINVSHGHRFIYSPQCLARYRVHSCSTGFVQKRGICVNRLKVFGRILRQYTNLPRCVRANIVFQMGVGFCNLGKFRIGRNLLWKAVAASATDLRSVNSSCRALWRLIVDANKNLTRLPGRLVGSTLNNKQR